MPEGDTVHKLAVFLHRELCAAGAVAAVRLHPALGPSRAGPLVVEAVTCKGKHLYLAFGDGSTLRSHLGLYGSWHRYRPGEPWRKPARQASIRIETATWHFICFNAREAEWLRSGGLRELDSRQRLGPALIGPDLIGPALVGGAPQAAAAHAADWQRRTAALIAPDTLLVDLLLDQRIAAGIGNVYKSEVLFLTRCPPLLRLADLAPARLIALYRLAARLLAANLGGGPRHTRRNLDGRGPLWVYARAGLPCLHCGTPITRADLGERSRPTWWCPRCQAPTGARPEPWGNAESNQRGPCGAGCPAVLKRVST